MKRKARASLDDLNEMEVSYLPDEGFKIMVIKMLTTVRRTKYEQSENFNNKASGNSTS